MFLALTIITLTFALINGIHDGPNVVATIIASRSMSPRKAIWLAAGSEFIGALVLGTTVALTIGRGILADQAFILPAAQLHLLLLGALLAAIIWNLLTWFLGLPSSSSHALIGGLVGAGIAALGPYAVLWHSLWWQVLVPLFVTPLIAFAGAFILVLALITVLRNCAPSMGVALKRSQFFSVIFLAMGHGSNDAQKAIGILALAAAAQNQSFEISDWMILAAAGSLALGVTGSGLKIVKTINRQVAKVTPLHSFTSQVTAAILIIICSMVGFPVSINQIIGPSVMGAGAGFRAKSVRWGVAKDIFSSWFITIPATSVLAAGIYLILHFSGVA